MGRTNIPSPLVFLIFLSVTLSHCTGSYPKNASEGPNPAAVKFEKLVEFDRDIHFQTPDGQDVVVPPGSYTVEAFGDGLRFTSIDPGGRIQ